MKINTPLNIQISCHGWNPEAQRDELLATITLGIWVNTKGSTCELLEKTFDSPTLLWYYLQDLTSDPAAVLKRDFNYVEPEPSVSSLPLDLGDLFK